MRNASGESSATFREVLAIPEFRALYLAQTLSVVGDQLARIAVGVLVFSRTGSSALTGVSYAVSYLPWLIGGPTLSVLADRFPRRTVMVVCDTTRATLVAAISLTSTSTAALIALTGLVALVEPPFASARAALVPDVVRTPRCYATASILGNTTSQLAVVLGFAIGGTATTVIGARGTLAIDSLTFVASAGFSIFGVKRRPGISQHRTSWLREMKEGASVVFRDDELRWLVETSWLVVGTVIATEAVAVPYANSHGDGAMTAGLLTASVPAGVTLGAIVLGRLIDQRRVNRLLPLLALLTPMVLALTGFNPTPAIAGPIWFVAGALSAMTVIANRAFVAAVRPDVRGRAFGIAAAGISTAQGVGSLLIGLFAHRLGPAHAVTAIALPAFGLIVIATMRSRHQKARRRFRSSAPSFGCCGEISPSPRSPAS
jgi:MFS family permease